MFCETSKDQVLRDLYPHYTDRRFRKEQTIFCSDKSFLVRNSYSDTFTLLDCHYDYSDRLSEWDYKKTQKAILVANSEPVKKRTAKWFETYLSHFYGHPVQLVHIIAGVNHSNGYPYLVFGTRRPH